MTQPTPLRATALICTLKPGPAPSSSDLIAEHVLAVLREQGVACETVDLKDRVRNEIDLDLEHKSPLRVIRHVASG